MRPARTRSTGPVSLQAILCSFCPHTLCIVPCPQMHKERLRVQRETYESIMRGKA